MSTAKIKLSSSWPVVRAIIKAVADQPGLAIPETMMAALVDRIRAAIESSDRSALEEATAQTELLFREILGRAPDDARTAAQGTSADPAAATAFLLGQTAFAQLLAARVLDRRADNAFLATLTDRRYERYIQALAREPMHGRQLQDEVEEAEETVSRKLTDLRTLGIVDWRRDGTRIVNSLSPAARAAVDHLGIPLLAKREVPSDVQPEVQKEIDAQRDNLPDHLQKRPRFAQSKTPRAKAA